MWRAWLLIGVALASGACATGTRWERPEASDEDRRRDEAECAALANRDHSVPAQRIVTRSSGRTTEGMELVTVRDFDAAAFSDCMRTRGYRRVPVPPPA
jgi:hypothetical protein